jgi:transposase-like protein
MNLVQFQPGHSMREFLNMYGTDDLCEASLIARRWPCGFECPRCAVCVVQTSFARQGWRYWQCADCQYQCSAVSGTIFESSKLPLTSWFLAIRLLNQSKTSVSALELKRHLGVCYRSAWLVTHKILEVMRLAEADRQLTARLEIDDACLGGELSGGEAGRG